MAEEVETQQDMIEQLGNISELRDSLNWLVTYWTPRNTYIEEMRLADEGLNAIEVPKSAQYKARSVHLGTLSSVMNEKNSRYMSLPEYLPVIDDPTDEKEVERLSNVGRFLNVAGEEMERLGDGDVW